MTDKPIRLLCPCCGSENITRDGLAHWHPETQQWELSATLDNMDCSDCEATGISPREVPI